jgi:hypothetical protein
MDYEAQVRRSAGGDVRAFVELTRRFQQFAFGSAVAQTAPAPIPGAMLGPLGAAPPPSRVGRLDQRMLARTNVRSRRKET